MGVFSYFCLEPSGLSLRVISTTPGLPPQLLCRHFLHLLAQTVQSPTVKKWQEMWVPIGLKTGSSCPPNIFLHVPLLPDFTQLRSTHMGAGFLLPCGLSQVTPYLSPPKTKTQPAAQPPEPAFYWTLTSLLFFLAGLGASKK